MKKNHFILCLMLVFVFQSQAQRYFEFHFPPDVKNCIKCEGYPKSENFIVKLVLNSEINKILDDLNIELENRIYSPTGRTFNDTSTYNLSWQWVYDESNTGIVSGTPFEDCISTNPSFFQANYDSLKAHPLFRGRYCPLDARVKSEVFPVVVSLLELENQKSIKVFPNPTTDFIVIRFTHKSNKISTIEAIDATGKRVFKQAVSPREDEWILNKTQFPHTGVYTLHFKSANQLIISKKIQIL